MNPIGESWQRGQFRYIIFDRCADALMIVGIAAGMPWGGVWRGERHAQLFAIILFSIAVAATRRWLVAVIPKTDQMQLMVGAARKWSSFVSRFRDDCDIRCNSPFVLCFLQSWFGLAIAAGIIGSISYFLDPVGAKPDMAIVLIALGLIHPMGALTRTLALVTRIRVRDGVVYVGYRCGAVFRTYPQEIVVVEPSAWSAGTEFVFPGRIETLTRIRCVNQRGEQVEGQSGNLPVQDEVHERAMCVPRPRRVLTWLSVLAGATLLLLLGVVWFVRFEASIDLSSGCERRCILIFDAPVSSVISHTWVSRHILPKPSAPEWRVVSSRRIFERYGPHYVDSRCSVQTTQLQQVYTSNRKLLAGAESALCDSLIKAWKIGGPDLADEYLEKLSEHVTTQDAQGITPNDISNLFDSVASSHGRRHTVDVTL